MQKNDKRYHLRSIRLKGYDYSEAGSYFVTICTQKRECILGEIFEDEMRVSPVGEIVQSYWIDIPNQFPNVHLDAFVIMPNYIHGIIMIMENTVGAIPRLQRDLRHELPLPEQSAAVRRRMLLPKIVGKFKMTSAKCINHFRGTPGQPVWQRNYYEHIIRNEREFSRIHQYITENPLHWGDDGENPLTIRDAVA